MTDRLGDDPIDRGGASARPSLAERAAERLEDGAAPGGDGISARGDRTDGPDNVAAMPFRQRRTGDARQRWDGWPGSWTRIDTDRLSAAGALTPKRMRSHLADEVRLIKHSLLPASTTAGAGGGNVIMLTSALPGEGKSFLAVNLAVAIASERDREVVLVDADFERGTALDRTGITPGTGLLDVLRDQNMDFTDAIVGTDIDGLYVVGGGRRDDFASELLGSQRMRAFMSALGGPGGERIVLVDAQPLLASAEPASLAAQVGQVALTVQADRTDRNSLDHALDLLPDGPACKLVLNRTQGGTDASGIPGSAYKKYRR
jgi:Mrp family chromosome partitioning ATPase